MAVMSFDEFLKKAKGTPDQVRSLSEPVTTSEEPYSPGGGLINRVWADMENPRIQRAGAEFEAAKTAEQRISSPFGQAKEFTKALGEITGITPTGRRIAAAIAPFTESEEDFANVVEELAGGVKQERKMGSLGKTLQDIGAPEDLAEGIDIAADLPLISLGLSKSISKALGLAASRGPQALQLLDRPLSEFISPRIRQILEKDLLAGPREVKKTVQEITEPVLEKVSGITQKGKEVVERVPRFVGRISEGLEEASERAEKIRTSTPVVQEAIKSNLDQRIINTVQQADQPTVKAYKEIIDIADTAGTTLKPKQRPEIIAGKASSNQYALIEKQRKNVGSRIGERVKELSKTVTVPITDSISQVDNVLAEQGIKKTVTKSGAIKLDLRSSRFTPSERARIEELYKLATEGGQQLTPAQIYGKDQLFSKLQRESRFEGVGDIIVDVEGKQMSLFRVFRDIFTNKLDTLSPKIRGLNREYRNLVTFIDDIENSIIKTGNFETLKGDPAEFAQTNLRRILSDAQSAAAYREILGEMDILSRSLGYEGARPDDLIAFATEMRKLYPDIVPPTGFTGGIKTGLFDIAKGILEVGKPDIKDQQKALRELIESAIKSTKE